MKRARVMRFIHLRVWTEGVARPACNPLKRNKMQLTPDPGKVTCGSCLECLDQGGVWTTV